MQSADVKRLAKELLQACDGSPAHADDVGLTTAELAASWDVSEETVRTYMRTAIAAGKVIAGKKRFRDSRGGRRWVAVYRPRVGGEKDVNAGTTSQKLEGVPQATSPRKVQKRRRKNR